MPDPLLLAVCGKPVIHSCSPHIFNALFKHLGINAHYLRLAADSAQESLATAEAMNLSGLNVTSPFKSDMASLLDVLGPQASVLSAVNTVTFSAKTACGFNTDADGVVHALESHGYRIPELRAVVLGAGGAARAAVFGLLQAGAPRVIVVNRTQERAEEVSLRLDCDWAPVASLAEILSQSDVLISCIPSGRVLVDPAWLYPGLVVLDADYRDLRLSKAAEEKECRVISGLFWLLGQAIPGFRYFTGQEVPLHLEPTLGESLIRMPSFSRKSLALTGFMGAGKTTVGMLLAEKKGYRFMDTDACVEELAGMPIPAIFENQGEDFFRKLERSVIHSLIEDPAPKVIALGGGAVMDSENRDVLRRNFLTVWLWVSPRSALGRLNSVTRPLLKASEGEDLAAALLKERMPGYAASADLVLSTDSRSAAEIMQRISYEMDQTL